jgi:Domain of unknown function (DUF4326)
MMTERPIRIQLSRAKGFKLQATSRALNGLECVKVDRTTKWGNPWPIGEWGPLLRKAHDAEGAVGLFRQMLEDDEMRRAAGYPDDLSALRGKNLACWCASDKYCHAAVLLEMSNSVSFERIG